MDEHDERHEAEPGIEWDIEHYDDVPSTNDVAKERVADGAPHGTVIVAASQSGGRGRGDHTWSSPEGGLYASFILRDLPAAHLGILPLAAGVAALRAIDDLGPTDDILLKWPNDLIAMQDGVPHKVGGILVESASTGDRLDHAILGIGINVATDVDDLPADTEMPAGTLAGRFGDDVSDAVHVDPDDLLDELLDRVDEVLALLGSTPEQILLAANGALAFRGEEVTIETDEGTVTGTLIEIDATGAIRLDSAEGPSQHDAWNVRSLRPT